MRLFELTPEVKRQSVHLAAAPIVVQHPLLWVELAASFMRILSRTGLFTREQANSAAIDALHGQVVNEHLLPRRTSYVYGICTLHCMYMLNCRSLLSVKNGLTIKAYL